MPNETREIPLFPLHVVMFPEMALPLHIFEERYRRMISACIASSSEFGIVYGTDEGFSEVGCAAVVTALIERFPDGRMNILTRGTRRLRVLEHFTDASRLTLPDSRPAILALTEWVEDEDESADPATFERVLQRYGEALRLVAGWAALQTIREITPARLSFVAAAQLGLEPEDKQAILETRSVQARLERILCVLEGSLPGIREMKRRTGGNGHFG